MPIDPQNTRSRAEIRKSLLDRAYERGGEAARAEMQQKIQELFFRVQEDAEQIRGLLDFVKAQEEAGVSRTVRAFNEVARREGRTDRLMDNSAKPVGKEVDWSMQPLCDEEGNMLPIISDASDDWDGKIDMVIVGNDNQPDEPEGDYIRFYRTGPSQP